MEPGTRARFILLAATATLAALTPQANAHAYLKTPAARNWIVAGQNLKWGYSPDGFYNPMSLNRAGKPTNGATCGAVAVGNDDFEVGGRLARRKITAEYKAGQTFRTTVKVQFAVQISINHWGYIQMRLCPLSGTSDDAESKDLSEACLQKYTLLRADNRKDKYWIYKGSPGSSFLVLTYWKLPAGVTCERCVLQMTYVTAHMCYPPGIDKARMLKLAPGGNRDCPSDYLDLHALPSEKFWNCADIRIQ